MDPQLTDFFLKLGAFGALCFVVWQFLRVDRKGADNSGTLITLMGRMQDGALKRDQQIDLIIKSMDRNALAAEEQNKKLEAINNATVATGNRMQTLHDGLVQSWNEQSTAFGKQAEDVKANSIRIGEELKTRFDKLPADILKEFDPSLKQIREDLSKIIDPDIATQIANALQPGLVSLVERVLVDCLKQNTELVKELDKTASPIDDTATRQAMLSMSDGEANRKIAGVVEPPQPEPPTPSNAVDPVTGEDRKVA